MHAKFLSAALVASAAAYPSVKSDDDLFLEARDMMERVAVSSENEDNCGFFGCGDIFSAKDQFVDVRPGSGHEFRAPRWGVDVRGPCPGLNAAANHAFASRTGVFDHDDTVNGLFEGLGIGRDFTQFLFIFSVFNSGSVLDAKWSIGGPFKSTTLGVLAPGLGLSNSHNKYEGDSSTGRGDAFLHNGDAHSLNMPNFMEILKFTKQNGNNFDFVQNRRHIVSTHRFTKENNPLGFFGPFNFFVSPIAHHFVTAFMSNRSKESPGGVLNKYNLLSFFSIKEHKDGTYEWLPGHDRIPDNWYKRPPSRPYGAAAAIADLALAIKENPEIGEVGGNTGKAGQYVGLDLHDLTGGVANAKHLTDPIKLQCFILQAFIVGVPGLAQKLVAETGHFFKFANKFIGAKRLKLGCARFQVDRVRLGKYPGYTTNLPYQPPTPY